MKLKKPHFVPILEGPKTPEQDFSQKIGIRHFINYLTSQIFSTNQKTHISGSDKRTENGKTYGGYFIGLSPRRPKKFKETNLAKTKLPETKFIFNYLEFQLQK